MPLVKVKPTSPGRRALVKVVTPELHKGDPFWPLTRKQSKTVAQPPRHDHHAPQGRRQQAALPRDRFPARQGRHQRPRRAARIRSEPQRAPRAAALRRRRAPLRSRPKACRSAPSSCPGRGADQDRQCAAAAQRSGHIVHCVEMLPGKGAQLARSAGTGVQVLAREGSYAQLRLRSGEIRKVHIDCRATIGEAATPSTISSRSARRAASAGAACARRCAAWR